MTSKGNNKRSSISSSAIYNLCRLLDPFAIDCGEDIDTDTDTDIARITPAQISKLHEDVLWKIFLINADMKNDTGGRIYQDDAVSTWTERALIITWSCSHVCRRWRDLIVHSPSLWGRLIDLDCLASVKPLWKDEIIRRTGASALVVNGTVFAQKPVELNFILSILQDCWPRIQILKVRFSRGTIIPNHTWDLLYRPAPALQAFRIESRDGFQHPIPSSSKIGLIFANNAPLIRHFSSWKFDLKLTPEMGWTSRISRLDISYTSSMSIDDWLLALGHMPQLEYLNLLLALPIPPDTTTSTQLHLPNLGEIRVNDRLRSWAVFLTQILPSIGCYLYLSTVEEGESLGLKDITLASQVLSRYSRNWFNNHFVTTLSLFVFHTSLFIDHNGSQFSNPDAKIFHVDVGCTVPSELPTIFPLLNSFSSCDFKSITTLDFQVNLFPSQTLDSNVRHFLVGLPSVETLQVFQKELHALVRLEEVLFTAAHHDPEIIFPIFPQLRSIKVLGQMEILTPETAQTFVPFLASRRESHPVQVLDLTDWQLIAKLDILDEIVGLKVRYNHAGGIQERICGTSDLLTGSN